MSCLLAATSHASSTLVISGVEGELADNIRLLVDKPPSPDQTRAFRRYIDSLPEQAIKAISAYGYYSATADVIVSEVAAPKPEEESESILGRVGRTLTGGERETSAEQNADAAEQPATTITQITLQVTPNSPVTIRTLNLEITGLEDNNADFVEVATDVRAQLAKGKVFVSSDYESSKSAIQSVAQDLGYFDFEYTQASVRVSRRDGFADISLTADVGKRFNFGEIAFKQSSFSQEFMNRWVPFAQGDPFQADLIGELTQNLQGSGYFSSVRVRPLIDPRYEQTVPISVELTRRELNQVAVGIGYSSDTKLRTKLTWAMPLLNRQGHSTEFGVSLSKDTQSASFAYRIPRSKDPLFNYWGIEYGLKNETLVIDSFLSTLNLQRVRRTPRDWAESLFIRWERETFDAGGIERTTDLVLPGFSYSRSRSKGEPFATWGQSVSFQLMGGSERLLSSIDIIKGLGRFRYLRAVSNKNTLIATLQFGAIQSNDYNRVPITQRFFAGGDNTIRGFAFRDISPRNPEGIAVGGRYIEVLNLEYNYRFRDRWSFALFTDAGRAFNNFDTPYSIGAGFGIRWQSPVGPFRVDIATPISDDDGNDIRIHLSLGPDL